MEENTIENKTTVILAKDEQRFVNVLQKLLIMPQNIMHATKFRAPMQSMPVIEEAFAISNGYSWSTGAQKILVICDYATRCPEAIPL